VRAPSLALVLLLPLFGPVATAPSAVAATGATSFDLTAKKAGWSGEAAWKRQGTRLVWAGSLAAPGCQTGREAVAVFRAKPEDGRARLVEVMRTCDAVSDTGAITPSKRLAWVRPLLYVCDTGEDVPCGKPKDAGPTIRKP
jgi:hypothetical protein